MRYFLSTTFALLFITLLNTVAADELANTVARVHSPSKQISVKIGLDDAGSLQYQVLHRDKALLKPSPLGLVLNNSAFVQGLSVDDISEVSVINDSYALLTGKKQHANYLANAISLTVINPDKHRMKLTFQLSNDGVAFRYTLLGQSVDTRIVTRELSAYHFYQDTIGWLQPKAEAQSGWMNTNPSYEEDYFLGVSVKTQSPTSNGWVYPALFKRDGSYLLISEAGGEPYYSGTNLTSNQQGEFTIRFPNPAESITNSAYLPQHSLPFSTPWRILLIGDLQTVIESTLGTDLARPNALDDSDFIKPGIAAWSWGLLKDDFTTYPVQKQFIDYAADMQWQYVLVDADWDQKIGLEKLSDLARYATGKQVGLWVWYNSSGDWNKTVYSPKSSLLTHADRMTQFSQLRDIGVKGIKVDFFPGDGASVMAYYEEILKDAAANQLMVNFHGATLPRGLQRTYPNLLTVEAVKGFEMITFMQEAADREAIHSATLPFTRNVFDPMDFTPMVLGQIPNIRRTTSNAFQLALPVLFLSGVQHLVTTPAQMADVPEFIKQYLSGFPSYWQQSRFIDGYPGEFVVIARKARCNWYVAGINAKPEVMKMDLNLDFTRMKTAQLLSQGESQTEVVSQTVKDKQVSLSVKSNSGFVLVTQSEDPNECEAN